MTKKMLTAMLLLLVTTYTRATDYATFYENTPVELKQVAVPVIPDTRVNITDYGAVGDGATLCTEAFAKAIADLKAKGGGHLDVPAGVWFTGPIALEDNIDLHVKHGAIILFSPDKNLYVSIKDGEKQKRCVPAISANNKKNISITGHGIIDGNGKYWRPVKRSKVSDVEWKAFLKMGGTVTEKGDIWYPYPLNIGYKEAATDARSSEALREDVIRFTKCENVMFRNVTIQNSPRFHVHPVQCNNVIIDGITVRCPWNAQNGDAIDLGHVKRALIVNTIVDAGDDGLCMKSGIGKSGYEKGSVEDILIQDCKVYHAHGGFVLGSDCAAGMKNIVVRRCSFSGTDTGLRFKSGIGRGGKTENIFISDISMNNISNEAIVFENTYVNRQVGQDASKDATQKKMELVPDFQDIHINNVVCRGADTAIRITGIPEAHIHDIYFKDVIISDVKKTTDMEYTDRITMDNVVIDGKVIVEK